MTKFIEFRFFWKCLKSWIASSKHSQQYNLHDGTSVYVSYTIQCFCILCKNIRKRLISSIWNTSNIIKNMPNLEKFGNFWKHLEIIAILRKFAESPKYLVRLLFLILGLKFYKTLHTSYTLTFRRPNLTKQKVDLKP